MFMDEDRNLHQVAIKFPHNGCKTGTQKVALSKKRKISLLRSLLRVPKEETSRWIRTTTEVDCMTLGWYYFFFKF